MSNDSVVIKSVWESNFHAEMSIVKQRAMSDHPFVSLTTRLLLCRERIPAGKGWGNPSINYIALRVTVNEFKDVVQVGLALCDKLGKLPLCKETGKPCVWEFNLKPVEAEPDVTKEERFLKKFCSNVNAEQLRSEGIHPARFAAELRDCGLLMRGKISWVVFKGGLDFMALMRSWATQGAEGLTLEYTDFIRLLALYFPLFYDMAAVLGFHPVYDNGTIDVSARSINVSRECEPVEGAASDSLLALRMFMRMKMMKKGCELLEKKAKVLFGVTSEEEAKAVPTPTASWNLGNDVLRNLLPNLRDLERYLDMLRMNV
ncbi:putative CCR4-associated factor 1-like protein 2 [Nymphaea thermarum]|nr:putative CCR4-associated factor 1-like protein 2 [Nymphaea thermarum]